MIKHLTTVAVMLMSGTMAHATSEPNVIELLGQANDQGNYIETNITGSNNALTLRQSMGSASLGNNVMNISINGDSNGGPSGFSFTGVALQSGLQPGVLLQEGYNNSMLVDVTGSSNLFSFLQSGSNNALTAKISGTGNQAAVQQYGQNNHVSLSQMGSGNSISISQRSF
ncbi:hypothetical protein [Cohaesibacter celericrescens]|nr:hypothetical protein [Cohaesibacter celericrescens]